MARTSRNDKDARGPFRVDQLHAGDRYELSDGHPIYCAPTGGDGSRGIIAASQVLDTDPDVDSAGVDAGYALDEGTLRAPDIAVGGVPDAPGWIRGRVPPLAVEYAGKGQDEAELQEKIVELLAAGTRWVWVVRLLGPRRVEVYASGANPRILGPGDVLEAPGVLRNPVPVEALYDRTYAHELTLRNLLQRRGYASIEAIREDGIEAGRSLGRTEGRTEGRNEGREEGNVALRGALREILAARGLTLDAEQAGRLDACSDSARLGRWVARAATVPDVAAIFADAGE